MFEGILGSVVTAAASSLLSTGNDNVRSATSTEQSSSTSNPMRTAMANQSAQSLMSPTPRRRRTPSEPAKTAKHPLSAWTNAFIGNE